MGLSGKMIFLISAIAAAIFIILLVIQFAWIQKSLELDRRQFDYRMNQINDKICESLSGNKKTNGAYLLNQPVGDLFENFPTATPLETYLKNNIDSVLKRYTISYNGRVEGRTGSFCYFMQYVKGTPRNEKLDHCEYKLCLCSYFGRPGVDIGFDINELNRKLVTNSSVLIVPSVILLLLLVGLFTYIIYVINKQKSLAELKHDFINNLTHEFNTPLFSIGLTSRLLSGHESITKSDKLKGYVDLIITEKNRIQTQVQKMLQITAIESGSLILEKRPVDMHKQIEKNIASYLPVASDKKGQIQFDSNAACHTVMGDEVHLFNVISNLLDNACKYSKDQLFIRITTQNTGRHLIIKVEDNGIGIPENAIRLIFDKFYRAANGDKHDVKGFGLGLSYTKKIIEMHRGTIQVWSRVNQGTRFIIMLPVKY